MYCRLATAFFAIASVIPLTVALLSTQLSAREATLCGLSLAYHESSDDIDLTLYNQGFTDQVPPDSAVIGRGKTTAGADHVNFGSSKPNYVVLSPPEKKHVQFGNAEQTRLITWAYGSHKSGGSSLDSLDCDKSWSTAGDGYTCIININCGD